MLLANMYRSAEERALTTIKETDILGEDGLYYCSLCSEPTQFKHSFEGREYTLSRQCECDRKAFLERESDMAKVERAQYVETLKKRAFLNYKFREYTFARDDGRMRSVSDFCKEWSAKYKEMKEEGIGVMFYGNVGTGKSFYACAIANDVMERHLESVMMIDMNTLLNKVSSFDSRQRMLDDLDFVDLLIIDDFGTTRNTEFAWENIYTIINNRSRTGKPLIVTTNLAPSDFDTEGKEMPLDQARVYDRILDLCPLEIKMSGGSRRKERASEKVEKAKEIMGRGSNGSSSTK